MKKIAIVCDQLQEFGGAERVLVELKKIYPEADVFTSFYNPETLGSHKKQVMHWNIVSSWADRIPLLKKLYSPFRFLTPYIWESFNFKGYDLVISSSGSYMCKGIITRPETMHICYLHHPPRYLYYYETAIEWQKHWPIRVYGHFINHGLRMWDYLSSQRVDFFIANSEETKKRIQKCYRRDATVIYPPVSIPVTPTNYQLPAATSYYITTSRLARAKHIDVLIHAANKEKFHLKIIGSGRDAEFLRSIAGPTVEFLSDLPDEDFEKIYKNAKAFLFASVDEEFGIAPIEAMGYGIPVIAYASGGLIETVEEGSNGYLYHTLTTESLLEKIRTLDKLSEAEYTTMRKHARETAEKYTAEVFTAQIKKFIASKIANK